MKKLNSVRTSRHTVQLMGGALAAAALFGCGGNGSDPAAVASAPSDARARTGSASVETSAATTGAPVVLYTDITSGPTSGGENNAGIYLTIFGRNFGSSLTNLAVDLGGHAVGRVISVGNSRIANASSALPIEQIVVQVGALGGATNGTALPIDVAVGGVHSNTNLTFTPWPGNIYFVSPNGVDTTTTTSGGTFTAPFKSVQKPGLGTSFSIQPASVSGAYGRVRAGDFIVMRAGTYTSIGFQGYFMQTLNKSGCPIGTNCPQGGGTSSGPITLMGYPGETAFIERTNTVGSNQGGGGISSADSARQELGYGAYWNIVNLKIESGFDDGPVNTQRGDLNPNGGHWRVVNNELTAVSCQISTTCRAGGISGGGLGHYWVGNYAHDVYDGPNNGSSPLEMHGIYIGYNGSYEIAYSVFASIFGGNGIQTHGSTSINNVDIHHNVIHDVGKHGINIADTSQNNFVVWDNVVYNTQCAGIRMGGTSILHDMKVYNNLFYNTGLAGNTPSTGAITNDMQAEPNQLDVRNNIFVPHPGSAYNAGDNNNVNFQTNVGPITNNLWYGGSNTNPSKTFSTASQAYNPQFISTTTPDFHLVATSPARSAGTTVVTSSVSQDFDGTAISPNGPVPIGPYSE